MNKSTVIGVFFLI